MNHNIPYETFVLNLYIFWRNTFGLTPIPAQELKTNTSIPYTNLQVYKDIKSYIMIAITTTLLPGARLSSSINPRLAAHLLPRNGGIRASEEPLRTIAAWWNSIVFFFVFFMVHMNVSKVPYTLLQEPRVKCSKRLNNQNTLTARTDWPMSTNRNSTGALGAIYFSPKVLELLLTCMCA